MLLVTVHFGCLLIVNLLPAFWVTSAAATTIASVTNVARGRPARQSSTYKKNGVKYLSSLAVDGNQNSCSRTLPEEQPWWSVQLRLMMKVQWINVTGSDNSSVDGLVVGLTNVSTDNTYPELHQSYHVCGEGPNETRNGGSIQVSCGVNEVIALYVIIQLPSTSRLGICEVDVYGEEVDGCVVNERKCSHTCTNNKTDEKGYTCTCFSGFKLQLDGHECTERFGTELMKLFLTLLSVGLTFCCAYIVYLKKIVKLQKIECEVSTTGENTVAVSVAYNISSENHLDDSITFDKIDLLVAEDDDRAGTHCITLALNSRHTPEIPAVPATQTDQTMTALPASKFTDENLVCTTSRWALNENDERPGEVGPSVLPVLRDTLETEKNDISVADTEGWRAVKMSSVRWSCPIQIEDMKDTPLRPLIG